MNVPPPKGHMYVVLFDCEPFTKRTILAQVNTIESERYDTTVRLEKGDHDFVKLPSFINYYWSEIITQQFFDDKCSTSDARMVDGKFSEATFERIFKGVTASRRTLPPVLIGE